MEYHPVNNCRIKKIEFIGGSKHVHFMDKNPSEFYENLKSFCGHCNTCGCSISSNFYNRMTSENCYCSMECYKKSLRFPKFALVKHTKSGVGIFIYCDKYPYGNMAFCVWLRYEGSEKNYKNVVNRLRKEVYDHKHIVTPMTWVNYNELEVIEKWRGKMKKVISEVFEKTKDALLVQEYLDMEIRDSIIDKIVLMENKEKILEEAKKLEKIKKEVKK